MQRLTSLCSVVNQMEPLRVLNHMFLPREVQSLFNSVYLPFLLVFSYWPVFSCRQMLLAKRKREGEVL
jgi:hypothetical protein